MSKFSSHFLTIFAKLTLSRFYQKVKKIDNDQRANFYFLRSKYPTKIDAIHQKQRRPMHHKATKQAKSTPTTHQKVTKQVKTTPKTTKYVKMGWDYSQKLTHSPHPDKLSHYLLWPLLVFELVPPLLSEKNGPAPPLACNHPMIIFANLLLIGADKL
ncbi:hypothetical protein [Campylobacter concisus]|uniref:hypothetical protein n=1 Tax=Campylobacter concisus TaxID=199 RepID=UPI00130E2038|nr:hypothetical protein [Campylobacter concisus]